MTPRPVFKSVSERLNFLFPPDSFVYINLSAGSSGRLPANRRFSLCEQLEQRGLSLAFPPNLDNETLDLSQTDEHYWTYHFPGLKHLHRRKQGILVGELLRGVDLKMAGLLMLRKLNIPANKEHYLLYFGPSGAWCCTEPEFQTEVNMTNLMIHVSHTGFIPWIYTERIENYSSRMEDPVHASQGFDSGGTRLKLLQLFGRQFRQIQEVDPDFEKWDHQALLQDPDVLNTLQALQQTETEKGFFKIIRGLLQEVYDEMPHEARRMVPALAQVIQETRQRPFQLHINTYTNSIEFPELDVSITLQPLDFALYRLFYNHPEGFKLNERRQYLDEMRALYRGATGYDDDRINGILEPMFVLSRDNGSMNQSISRIKARFRSRMSDRNFDPYIITGGRNQPFRIACDRNLIYLVG